MIELYKYAERDPLTTDNDSANTTPASDDNIVLGKVWVNTAVTPHRQFVCRQPTGTAVWEQLPPPSHEHTVSDVTGLQAALDAQSEDIDDNAAAIAANAAAIAAINDELDGPGTATNVYLSGANGNDANDGLTPASAVATYARVWELLPSVVHRPFIVHVGAHGAENYVYELPPENRVFAEGAFIVLYGDGAGQAGEDGFTVVASGVAGAGTTATVLELAVAPATDAYAGFTAEYTSGAAAGQRRLIRDTVAALATLVVGTETVNALLTPLPGDTYRVVRPAAIVNMPVVNAESATASSTYFSTNAPVHVVNLRVTSGSATRVGLVDAWTFFFGVELVGLLLGPSHGLVNVGFDGLIGYLSGRAASPPANLFIRTFVADYVKGSWNGWGLSAPGNITGFTDTLFLPELTYLVGYVVADNVICAGGTAYLCGGRVSIVNGTAGGEVFFSNLPCFFSGAAIPALIRSSQTLAVLLQAASCTLIAKSSTILALQVEASSAASNLAVFMLDNNAELLGSNAVSVSAPSSAGVLMFITSGSKVALRSSGATKPSVFSIPSGYGIICDKSSYVSLDGWTSFVAATAFVAGSKGEIHLGASLTAAAASVTASARVASVIGGGLFFHGANSVWTGSVVNGAVVEVLDGGVFEQTVDLPTTRTPAPGTLTITNTALGATAHGLKVSGGSKANLRGAANTLINANGYGVDARFGGQVYFTAQPSSVVGATADLIVDTAAGGQPDTALAVSESAIAFQTGGLGAFNGSLIARAA